MYLKKNMLKLWIILANSAIVIADDFIVVNYPDGLAFDASTAPIPIKQLKYVLAAIVGESASAYGEFSVLKINNVFQIPKLAFLATIKLDNAADYSALGTITTYPVQGRASGSNLRGIVDFEKHRARQTLTNVSRDVDFVRLEGQLSKSEVPEAKTVAQELRNLLTSNAVEHIIVDMKVKNFVAVHLYNKKTALEFGKLVDAFKKLKEILANIFFGILTYGPDIAAPANQSTSYVLTIDPIEFKQHNIAPAYDENYAIIFNIILWFTVAFGLALLAAIFALINMDPGRDSIIYRMTATRSKKDV